MKNEIRDFNRKNIRKNTFSAFRNNFRNLGRNSKSRKVYVDNINS